MTIERARELRALISDAMQSVDDAVAIKTPLLYPEWEPDANMVIGMKVRHEGILYKVLQAHVSQLGWSPTEAPSLFAKVLIPDEDVIPEWEQPDSTNAYMTGDVVMFNGVKYESLIDNNVWSPEAYPAGWKVVD